MDKNKPLFQFEYKNLGNVVLVYVFDYLSTTRPHPRGETADFAICDKRKKSIF